MIRFQYKADPVFSKIVESALENCINDCEEAQIHGGQELQLDVISERAVGVFGGLHSLTQVTQKLKEINDAEELYDVSDYYYFLLDDILTNWVEIYNSRVLEGGRLFHSSGKAIELIDVDDLIEHYFFDRDYTLDAQTADALVKTTFEKMVCDYSIEALNVARGILPDTSDLWIRKCDIDDVFSDDDSEIEYDWFIDEDEFAFEDENSNQGLVQ